MKTEAIGRMSNKAHQSIKWTLTLFSGLFTLSRIVYLESSS